MGFVEPLDEVENRLQKRLQASLENNSFIISQYSMDSLRHDSPAHLARPARECRLTKRLIE
jgi:hypothetical protein